MSAQGQRGGTANANVVCCRVADNLAMKKKETADLEMDSEKTMERPDCCRIEAGSLRRGRLVPARESRMKSPRTWLAAGWNGGFRGFESKKDCRDLFVF
jgi:hypothetical protein